MQEKQQRMDGVIDAMGGLGDYEISDVTAAATYYMAETYLDFSRSLAESERPSDLEPADLDEYELALEEEAFPFEEKAIEFHEENLELLHAGVFNAWTERSLGKLAGLVPGRYAKDEMSSDLIVAIDSYVYRSPASEQFTLGNADTTLQDDSAETTQLAPRATDDGVVEDESP